MGAVQVPRPVRIVALDTTAEHGSIALVEDGALVEQHEIHSPDGFGHVLFVELNALMGRHGWVYDSVHGFAAASGPGSFTGVRVGLSAAKGLADVTGTKAAAVSNLQAMAVHGTGPVRAPFFDARRGEIYGGLYDAELNPLAPETVGPLEAWLAALPEGAELLTIHPEAFAVTARAVPRALASAIALLAPRHWRDAAELDANYVRRSDAELKWTDR
jgi:tRNA threonylcarbamoyladenosine biosynthesis protein TsaB